MRFVSSIFLIILTSSSASAVDYRWTLGFAQGTSESIIENANGASVNIYCPSGREDRTPGMYITSNRVKPAVKEQVTVQIMVDGTNHPFYVQDGHFEAASRTGLQDLQTLVGALAKSRQKSFAVEYPKYNVVETFSLLDARRSLGTGKKSVLFGCDR